MPTPGLNLQPHSVSLLGKTTTADTSGGQAVTYQARMTFPCFVAPAQSSVKLYYSQRQLTVTHSIYTSSALTVSVGDVVQFGSRLFSVHGALNHGEYGFGSLWQLDCLEVTGTNLIIQTD